MSPLETDIIAAAIANARGCRRGIPPIKNILSVLPQKLVDEVRDDAEAALSALSLPAWQPIETAPQDSRWFLAFGSGSGFAECQFICRWSLVLGCWTQVFDPYNRPALPTSWMPLPDPPVAEP